MQLFSCPLCGQMLERMPSALGCPSGHRFDLSAEGYAHLLPPNRKHSKNPGDDKAMVAARANFLQRGYYAPLLSTLCDLICSDTQDISAPVLLDSGCGEGYYTTGFYTALTAQGHAPQIAGVDISKFAVKRAAKRLPQGQFAVASVYQLPLPDDSAHCITNIFSPLATEEFSRILKANGIFYYVVPAPRHLWEMKGILYENPYENEEKREDYPGFQWMDATPVSYSVTLESSADIMALFGMTPYAWKTPKEGVERLAELDTLTTEIGFFIHRYRRCGE